MHDPSRKASEVAMNIQRSHLGNGMSPVADDPMTSRAASPRQWIMLAAAYLLIPLVLLLCGGDLGWWQAWIYSLLIVAVGPGGRIWAERRHPGLMAERQDMEKAGSAKAWDKVLAPLMALSLSFPLVIAVVLDWKPRRMARGRLVQLTV